MRRSSFPSRVAILAVGGLVAAGTFFAAAPAMAATPGSLSVDFVADNIDMSGVSSDGATIALSSYDDSRIILIDTATNTATTVADPGKVIDGPGGIVFSPDDSTIYVANYGAVGVGNLLVIDVATATITAVVTDTDGLFKGPWVLARNLAGTVLYVGDFDNKAVYFFDIASKTVTKTVDVSVATPFIYGLYASPDAARLFAVDTDGSIDVIDVDTAAIVDTWTDALLGNSRGGCISPDGLSLFQPDFYNEALYKTSLVNGDVLAKNLATERPQNADHPNCAVSPDGASVFLTHTDAHDPGSVTEYNATTLAHIATHEMVDVSYTQQIQFFSECRAYVAGENGDAQTLDLDCPAAPAKPELADTGLGGQAVAATAWFSALLLGAGMFALYRRRVGAEGSRASR